MSESLTLLILSARRPGAMHLVLKWWKSWRVCVSQGTVFFISSFWWMRLLANLSVRTEEDRPRFVQG